MVATSQKISCPLAVSTIWKSSTLENLKIAENIEKTGLH